MFISTTTFLFNFDTHPKKSTATRYEKACKTRGVACIPCSQLFPVTFELTNAKERQEYYDLADANPKWKWICKVCM